MYRKPFNANPGIQRDPMDAVRRVSYTGNPARITKFNPNSAKSRKLAQLLPTMQSLSRKQNEPDDEPDPDSSKKISVTAIPLPSSRPTRGLTRGSEDVRENFTEFSKRILSASSHLDLDPELQAAFRDLSGGSTMNLFSINSASISRAESRARTAGPEVVTDGLPSSAVDSYEIGTTSARRRDLDPYDEKVFETTFGAGTAGLNFDRYRDRNRPWTASNVSNVTQATRTKLSRHQEKKVKDILKNISNPGRDHEKILKQGARLLEESAKFRMKPEPEPQPELTHEEKMKKIMEYFPYTSPAYMEEQRELLKGKMTIYERLLEKRQEALRRRFAEEMPDEPEIAPDEPSPDQELDWRQNAGQKRASEVTENKSEVDENRNTLNAGISVPFSGLTLSSLVGNRAAALHGFQGKRLDPKDQMNPLQQSMVEGLENSELSAFLPVGHGNRPPRQNVEPQVLLKSEATESKNPIRFQSATARQAPKTYRDSPFGYALNRDRPAYPSTAASILNPENQEMRKNRLEMILDKRSTFNKTKSRPQNKRRDKNGDMLFVPPGWSVEDFDDAILNGTNPRDMRKEAILKETKMQRIRQIQMRENQARTYNLLLQPPTWN